MLFGYEDLFVKNLHYMDPAKGGDPSLEYNFALNKNKTSNETTKEAMFTGSNGDRMLTRSY
jgi:hypothetical protein